MPLNTLRLNHQKSSHPNDRIVFIKPLPRPASDQASYDLADTFLRAIAAQCLPLMKNHYLSVTTLEEYEPNREFIGRNFNNGEIIQLVLRSKNGGWVPFRMVQMVMMHELAHNTHMNHGKGFWKARNIYAEEMKGLWAKGYTGEGFWGGGRTLSDMSTVMGNNVLTSRELEGLPLCGGTYRSRRRKRKAGGDGKELTWKEKKERRIEKKFGRNGVALGEDENARINLEISRKGPIGGKPRVAQSKRGRELRVAAALARFETNKQEVATLKEQDEETGEEEYEDADGDLEDATDGSGKMILDSQGHGMVRICEDEDTDDANVKREMEELEGLDRYFKPVQHAGSRDDEARTQPTQPIPIDDMPQKKNADDNEDRRSTEASTAAKRESPAQAPKAPKSMSIDELQADAHPVPFKNFTTSSKTLVACPICSLENPRLNATCMACAHVLDPKKDPRHWSCQSEACKDSGSVYLNAGDVGVCGICGVRRGA
ncbi:WLM domain-containing protein [Exophiala viscosa]|uniref:WLM domain-containing protein n=1 Tax=Exophiala viscosa TaxID=2486360 RepID=A0AAN6DS72_9EURO|nr:WLM domain-containing protein [Exophiala viscosa]